MVKVTVIGSGNVAHHLITALANSDAIELVQVFSRDPAKVAHLIAEQHVISNLSMLLPADLYIISVSDRAIAEVSNEIPFTGRLVVHTSGSLPVTILNAKNRQGVFYPVQTFTKNKALEFSNIPICIEANEEQDLQTLEAAAMAISNSTFNIESGQRKALHIAAVFANNFTNHLYVLADGICRENELPFDILKPLIAETADKVKLLTPAEAQTGPAKRHDSATIESHLSFLKDENIRNIYKTLTQSIIDHGKKL